MEVRQRIWLYGMRFWLLYTVQLLYSMKWLCEVRLGPIYYETQGSPHGVDDESFSNKVSRNSSPSLISYHLTAAISIFVRYPQVQWNIQGNRHMLMIFNTKVTMSLISPVGSEGGPCDLWPFYRWIFTPHLFIWGFYDLKSSFTFLQQSQLEFWH